jgi:hypothetical protein
MKKTLILWTALFLAAFHGNAQSKGALSVSLGPVIPLGDFANKDGFAATSGLANIGGAVDISYQHPFDNKNFGWLTAIRGRLNYINKSATFEPLEAEFPGYQWSMNNSHWSSLSGVLGGYYKLLVTPKLSLQVEMGLGVAQSWSPKQSIKGVRDSVGYGPIDLVEATAQSVTATAFTGMAGLSLSHRWNKRWSFVARASYSYLKPTFKNLNIVILQGKGLLIPNLVWMLNATSISEVSTTQNYTQSMSSVDILVGVTRTF